MCRPSSLCPTSTNTVYKLLHPLDSLSTDLPVYKFAFSPFNLFTARGFPQTRTPKAGPVLCKQTHHSRSSRRARCVSSRTQLSTNRFCRFPGSIPGKTLKVKATAVNRISNQQEKQCCGVYRESELTHS